MISSTPAEAPPTSPFTFRDAERSGPGQNRGIYRMTIEFHGNEKTVACSPIKVLGHSASMGKCINYRPYEKATL